MKIIKFLQQHHWAIASLSAAAVIATFLVKDVIREDTKELLDTMKGAQQELRTDALFLGINGRILETQLLVQQFGYGINDLDITTVQNDAKLMGERLRIEVGFNIFALGDTGNLFAMMGLIKEKFSDKLPKPMLDNLKSLNDKVDAQSGSLMRLQDRIALLTRRNSLNELALLYRNVKKDDPTRQPDGLAVQVAELSGKFTDWLAGEAEMEEHRYVVVTIVSRVIYVIAFGVGVVAQVLGIKGAGGNSG